MVLGLPSLWLCLTLQGRKRQRHSGSLSLALKSLRTPFLLSFPTLSQPFLPLPQVAKETCPKPLTPGALLSGT